MLLRVILINTALMEELLALVLPEKHTRRFISRRIQTLTGLSQALELTLCPQKSVPKPRNIHCLEEMPTIVRLKIPRKSILTVMLTSTRHNPGPGAYEPRTTLSATGNYFVGTMKNSLAPNFSLPSLKRFKPQ